MSRLGPSTIGAGRRASGVLWAIGSATLVALLLLLILHARPRDPQVVFRTAKAAVALLGLTQLLWLAPLAWINRTRRRTLQGLALASGLIFAANCLFLGAFLLREPPNGLGSHVVRAGDGVGG